MRIHEWISKLNLLESKGTEELILKISGSKNAPKVTLVIESTKEIVHKFTIEEPQ